MCSTPDISHLIVATVPTITIRGWMPFASAPLEPKGRATSGNDKPEERDINRDSYVQAARSTLPTSVSPHPRVPRVHTPPSPSLPPPSH